MPERVVTRRDWLRAATERLMRVRFDGAPVAGESAVRPDGGVGVDSPRLSAELLLRHVLRITPGELAPRPESAVPAAPHPPLSIFSLRRSSCSSVFLLACVSVWLCVREIIRETQIVCM